MTPDLIERLETLGGTQPSASNPFEPAKVCNRGKQAHCRPGGGGFRMHEYTVWIAERGSTGRAAALSCSTTLEMFASPARPTDRQPT